MGIVLKAHTDWWLRKLVMFFREAGCAIKKSWGLAEGAHQASKDLAKFYTVRTTNAEMALTSALKNETQGLAKFGITQPLREDGIISMFKSLPPRKRWARWIVAPKRPQKNRLRCDRF